jgi:4,5-DOPA dioxygenase extradiol
MQIEERVFPGLFVSHGAPTLALEENETVEFLRSLGTESVKPRAILCVSAHWGTRDVPMVSTAPEPETIHDFGGFSEALYRIRYPAKGAIDVARRAARLLAEAGIESEVSPHRGLDHGAWVPLMHMYPEADIPVTQLSVLPQAGPAFHFRLGQAIAPLRREGVLVLATGSATHNLSRMGPDGVTPQWAEQFDDWLYRKITGGEVEELLNYRQLAPYSQLAHPTEEHLLPLFVAMGAGGEKARGRNLHRGWTMGSLSMAAYSFD